MNLMMIQYDLNRSGQNYDSLITAIKSYGTYCKVLDSFWMVRTSQSADTVCEKLRKHMDNNDHIFVNRFDTSDYQWWLPKDVTEWIHRQKTNSLFV